MRVFVVNLEQSVERKLFMKQQLDALGLKHEFFPAVDGRKLTPTQLEEMCDMKVVREWANLLTPGMIGCSLSHYHLYQKMVNEKIDFAFVLEDDTRLSSSIPGILKQLEIHLKEGRLSHQEPILLYYQSKSVVEFTKVDKVDLNGNFKICYPIEIWRPITTAAYVISLSCAQRLTNLIYPIRYSPDSWAVYWREGAIGGLRCVLPLPVESGFFKSDIGYEENKIVNRFIKKLEQKKVFPIPQLLKWRRRNLATRLNRFRFSDAPMQWERKTFFGQ